MRRLLVTLVLLGGLAAPAVADVETMTPPPDSPATQPLEQPTKWNDLSQRDREREMQAQEWQGPSGFWTSPHKAKGSPYRFRLMAIGGVLLAGMGLFTVRLLRRASADRATRS